MSLGSHDPRTSRPTPAEQLSAPSVVNRRHLVVGGAVATMAAALAACGNQDTTAPATTTAAPPEPTPSDEGATTDLAVAELAAGLEVLAVQTYTAALDAATAGNLGEVPPVVAQYVTTAKAHHQEHLDAWNTVLTGAGRSEVTAPNAQLKPTVDGEFAKVTDVAGAANLALTLEQIAAQTYLKAIPTLRSTDAIRTAAAIQVVDQQHQAILLYALGMYPVPDVFQPTDKAVSG
ncbi:MAG: ferritin-like domain-containing protein [Pseudonocardiaceae bacterium]